MGAQGFRIPFWALGSHATLRTAFEKELQMAKGVTSLVKARHMHKATRPIERDPSVAEAIEIENLRADEARKLTTKGAVRGTSGTNDTFE